MISERLQDCLPYPCQGNCYHLSCCIQGKQKFHAAVNFPAGWDVHHSPNHWSNEGTMLRFIDKIIKPYIENRRKHFGVDQKGLCIFDIFTAHRCDSVKSRLHDLNIEIIFIPAGTTGSLQPLDLSVNASLKKLMKEKFSLYYANHVRDELAEGVDIGKAKICFPISELKPLHAEWLIEAFSEIEAGVIISG